MSQTNHPRLFTRDFVLLVVAHFLQALGFSSMLLLPLYLQHLEASRLEIGVIMATAGASGLVVRPLVGWSLDVLGRKPTLVAGTVILVAGMLLVAMVDRIGPAIYVARAVLGIGIGTLFTAYFTTAADVVPQARRTEGLALFGISGLVPLFVNPLADQVGISPPDLRWFLPLVGGLIALSLLAIVGLREPKLEGRSRLNLRELWPALRRRALWPVWAATAVLSAMVAVFMAFASAVAEQRGVDRPATLWLTYGIGAVVVRLFGGRLPDRLGPANFIAPAVGSYVCAALVVADAWSLSGFLVAGLFAGIGHGYCFPVLVGQLVERVALSVRGSAMAVFTALWGIAELLVSPIFGAVADHWTDAIMFWLLAVAALVGLVAWLVLEHVFGVPRHRSPPARRGFPGGEA